MRDELVEVLPAQRLPVDRDDLVARTDARARGGRALDGGDDGDVVVAEVDLDPHPAELAGGLALELRELLGRKVRRVRVELGDHALDGALGELGALGGLDVLVLDDDQDARELIQRRVRVRALRGRVGEVRGHHAAREGGGDEARGAEPSPTMRHPAKIAGSQRNPRAGPSGPRPPGPGTIPTPLPAAPSQGQGAWFVQRGVFGYLRASDRGPRPPFSVPVEPRRGRGSAGCHPHPSVSSAPRGAGAHGVGCPTRRTVSSWSGPKPGTTWRLGCWSAAIRGGSSGSPSTWCARERRQRT